MTLMTPAECATVHLPEDIARHLGANHPDLSRTMLEAHGVFLPVIVADIERNTDTDHRAAALSRMNQRIFRPKFVFCFMENALDVTRSTLPFSVSPKRFVFFTYGTGQRGQPKPMSWKS
jgi:hypothetical protein